MSDTISSPNMLYTSYKSIKQKEFSSQKQNIKNIT